MKIVFEFKCSDKIFKGNIKNDGFWDGISSRKDRLYFEYDKKIDGKIDYIFYNNKHYYLFNRDAVDILLVHFNYNL